VVSAVCLARTRVVERVAATPGPSLRADVVAGLRFVLGSPFQRAMVMTGTISNFVLAGQAAVVVVFLVREVRVVAGLVGVLFAIGALGALAGALLASRLADRYGDALLIRIVPLLVAGAGLLIPLTGPGAGLAWFVAGEVLMNTGIAVFNVCVRAAMQIGTPPALLGRAGTSIRLFSRGAQPLGAITGGTLATVLTARSAIAILMACMLVVPVLLHRSPLSRVRRVAELTS
jgi:MFS family permease